LDKKTFKIMTYNVWFREDVEVIRRMDALGDLIKQHSPDFICFQVHSLSYELFSFSILGGI
jgi:tyrosyl-DNA phosphodiesterase 2